MIRTENETELKIIMALFAFLLFGGIACGSVYLMRHAGTYSGLEGYLTSFFKDTLSGLDKYAVFKSALRSNMIMLGVIFAAGFFKIGFMAAGACILRRGFVMGFAAASFIKCFGIKGLAVSLAYLPGTALAIPAFLIFCSVSGSFSLKKDRFQKNLIFSYIFFTALIITIFCAVSFFEGYLTTTFMTRFAAML